MVSTRAQYPSTWVEVGVEIFVYTIFVFFFFDDTYLSSQYFYSSYTWNLNKKWLVEELHANTSNLWIILTYATINYTYFMIHFFLYSL